MATNSANSNQEETWSEADARETSRGNIGLPFGLCKKHGILIKPSWTPKDAWNALENIGVHPPWAEKSEESKKHPVETATKPTVSAAYDSRDDLGQLVKRVNDTKAKAEETKPTQKSSKSRLKDFYDQRKKREMDFMYGEGNWKPISNKRYAVKHVKNDDEININTNNVKRIKDNYVLVVGNNQAVYLKDWQVSPIHTWNSDEKYGENTYSVKLNRKYFKPYTFRFNFDDFSFDKPDTFDDLLQTAREQDERGVPIALGHMNI